MIRTFAALILLAFVAVLAAGLTGCSQVKSLFPATMDDLDAAAARLDERSIDRTDRLREDVLAAERARMEKQTEYLRLNPGDVEGAMHAGNGVTVAAYGKAKADSDGHENANPNPKPSDDGKGMSVLMQLILTLVGGGGVGGVIAKVLDVIQDKKPFVTSKGVQVPETALGDAALAHLNAKPPAA